MKYCNYGPQSIAMILLPGSALFGTIPDVFSALPDLQLLALQDNPGLTGVLPPMPLSVATNMQLLDITATGLSQYSQCTNKGTTTATSPSDCLPDWLLANVTAATIQAKYEPALAAAVEPFEELAVKTLGVYQPLSYINTNPDLYGFLGCTCLDGFNAEVLESPPGTRTLSCVSDSKRTVLTAIIAVASSCGAVVLIMLAAFLIFRREILADIDRRRINHLKQRVKPGCLTENQRQFTGIGKDITIVLTDIAGSTALWEWNPGLMNAAINVHDVVLRKTMSKHYGHEVSTEGDSFTCAYHDPADALSFVVELQLAVLNADWPPGLSEHPLSADVVSNAPDVSGQDPSGQAKHTFRGLRVRAAVHSGIPTALEKHATTSQLSYQGTFLELTEAISSLPVGGQTLLSNQTLQLASDREQVEKARNADSNKGSPGWWRSFRTHLKRERSMPLTDAALPPEGGQSSTSRINSTFPFLAPHVLGPEASRPSRWLSGASQLPSASIHGPGLLPRANRETQNADAMLILDMGEYMFHDFPELGLDNQLGAAALKGFNLMQILPGALATRASMFPPLPVTHQVAPSFNDSPASSMASFMQTNNEQNPAQQLVSIVFCSPAKPDSDLAETASLGKSTLLNQYRSCVRTSLLLLGGVECQEKEGTFMIAFADVRMAAEWAMSVQLCLYRGQCRLWTASGSGSKREKLTAEAPATPVQEMLMAKIGIAEGHMVKVCPHKATGRIDYFGQCVNRAARLQAAATAGETVLDHQTMEELLEKSSSAGCPCAASQTLAINNYDRLAHLAGIATDACGSEAMAASPADMISAHHSQQPLKRMDSLAEAALLVKGSMQPSPELVASSHNIPIVHLAVQAKLKGSYALKGITGHPLLSELVPTEIAEALHAVRPRPRHGHLGQRAQRGKTTKMVSAAKPSLNQPEDLARQTYFTSNEVHALGKLFAELSNSLHKDGLIHKDEFALALFKTTNQSNLFIDKVFDNFDTKRNDVIDFEEFVHALSIFHPSAPLKEKAAFAFRIYDLDHTGYIEPSEVQRLLAALLSDNPAIDLSEAELQSIIEQTFEEADILRDGKIHPEEWQTFVHKNPSIINYMTLPVLKELTEKYPSFRDIAGL
ncbi:hypothetical protein WJX84_009388 [Apatococcus fuscideae]|uniref:Guanylate cyclase n=1 Tax=Apatococcus fuscideae TaxID=2026836 RepID=A0AAW1SZ66_9CHLO